MFGIKNVLGLALDGQKNMAEKIYCVCGKLKSRVNKNLFQSIATLRGLVKSSLNK